MTTIFTVTAVKALIYKTLEEDYGVTPTGGTLTTGSGGSGGLTQAQVQNLINTAIAGLPAPGVSQAQVDAAIATALTGLPPAGITQAQVETAIATALSGLPVPLSESQVNDLIAAALAGGLSEGQVQTLIEAALANLPDPAVGVTLAQVEAAVADAIAAVPAQVDAQIQAALAGIETFGPDEAQQVSDAVSLAQGVVNILGGKPDGGGTLADVAAVFGNLGATFEAQIEQATVEANANVQALIDAITGTPGSTAQDVADRFAMMAQAIGEAIQSGMKALPDKITLNVKSSNVTDKVTIASHQLTPHPPADVRSVDVDIAPYGDGKLTVGGKRVLTVDDALAAGGGGIDQAAVEAAVAAATAPLLARIAALEEEQKKFVYTEFMQEQFGNFNDLLSADIGGVTQLALAEQKKLQDTLDAITGKKNATVKDIETWQTSLYGDVQAVADLFNQAMNTINEVVEYVVTEYATKKELGATDAELKVVKDGLATFEQQVGDAVNELINQGFEEKIPVVLEALSAHLENVLSIFTSGGTPGQVVTPAQLTQLLADIAKDYATKTELATYAKNTDPDQIITAKSIIVDGIKVNGGVLTYMDDEYGNRLRLIDPDTTAAEDIGIVVVHNDLKELLAPMVRSLAAGVPEGVELPDDIDWTLCPKDGYGSNTVEARVLTGWIQFRGQVDYTYSNVGSYSPVRRLPDGFPKPVMDFQLPAFAIDSGVAYRIGMVRISTTGQISVAAPTGQFKAIRFDGLMVPVF